jgi:DDE superfamily endonuclease
VRFNIVNRVCPATINSLLTYIICRSKQLFDKSYPKNRDPGDCSHFKFSQSWFRRFKARYGISIRRITRKAQTVPDSKTDDVRSFHRYIRSHAANGPCMGPVGKWPLTKIANMDQTPLEFDIFAKGTTYETRGAKTVWVKTTASGLDKRQASVQLTVFADGRARIKPLIIFRGKGLRIPQAERHQWDRRVVVGFQENAWVNEEVMRFWIEDMWRPCISPHSLLVADVHRAQKTDNVLRLLAECGTTIALIPPGCTSLIQPLDVAVNAQFKQVYLSY